MTLHEVAVLLRTPVRREVALPQSVF